MAVAAAAAMSQVWATPYDGLTYRATAMSDRQNRSQWPRRGDHAGAATPG